MRKTQLNYGCCHVLWHINTQIGNNVSGSCKQCRILVQRDGILNQHTVAGRMMEIQVFLVFVDQRCTWETTFGPHANIWASIDRRRKFGGVHWCHQFQHFCGGEIEWIQWKFWSQQMCDRFQGILYVDLSPLKMHSASLLPVKSSPSGSNVPKSDSMKKLNSFNSLAKC